MKLRMRKEDGTVVECDYKPTPPKQQEDAVRKYLLSEGHRPSEVAMTLASMKPKRRLHMYKSLVLLGKVKQ